jgi:glucuronoarabinoxylan endo-1,4-beta-xylanase
MDVRSSYWAIRFGWPCRHPVKRDKGKLSKSFLACFFMLLLYAPLSQAQTATVNWTNRHQVIDGFGITAAAGAIGSTSSMSSALQTFLYNPTPPNIGLSLMIVPIPDGATTIGPNGDIPGDCSSVSSSCAGTNVGDIEYAASQGARIGIRGFTPPASMKSNGSTYCTSGSGDGYLLPADYAAFATWMANFVESIKTYAGVTPIYASPQGEPETCQDYPSAVWSASQLETFISANLGPTFAADGLSSTLIFMPENASYSDLKTWGTDCMTTSTCYQYVGGVNWHDYDASYSPPDSVNATPYPSGWASGKKYWMTEVGGPDAGYGPPGEGCAVASGWCPIISNGLVYAALIDDRLAVESANAYFYWSANGSEGLLCAGPPYAASQPHSCGASTGNPYASTQISTMAYIFGQYSDFVRPGMYRIDATHAPHTGVTVSAYNNASTGNLVIVATNYTASAISQTFTLTNAPTFATLTPYVTSATQQIAAQTTVALTSNSFTYSLPAQSITSFVGNTTTASAGPAAPTGLTASAR